MRLLGCFNNERIAGKAVLPGGGPSVCKGMPPREPAPLMPTDAPPPGLFDRFATAVANAVARTWFFLACVTAVLVWVPSYFLFGNVDTWQLIINTFTTVITFLLVALLQNTQARDYKVIHRKLNAVADALADLMETFQAVDPTLHHDLAELRSAVGLEHREGT